jgi:hypothetical protein
MGIRSRILSVSYLIAVPLAVGVWAEHARAQADSLAPQELVTRCFQTLADIRLPFNDSRRGGVQTQAQALALCDALIDAPRLNLTMGTIQSVDSRIRLQEAKDLIRRFQQYHETFFTSDKFQHVFNEEGFTKLLHDTGNPAAYFTLGTFSPVSDYSLAVTEPAALQIIRGGTDASRAGNFVRNASTNPLSVTRYLGSELYGTDRGLFSGIKRITSLSNHLYSGGEPPINDSQANLASYLVKPSAVVAGGWSHQWKKSMGGGFMGDPGFILLNSGLAPDKYSNGSYVLPRRWSREVLNAAFCRNGPYLKSSAPTLSSDISSLSSAPAFRKANDCLKCHSSMDPLAMGIRNVHIREFNETLSPPAPGSGNLGAEATTTFYPILFRIQGSNVLPASASLPNSFIWPAPATGNQDFFKSRAHGRLTYTSAWDGNQVSNTFEANAQVTDQLTGLGNQMRNSADLYLCGTIRYFEMLSGVKINLESESLPDLAPSTSAYEKKVWADLRPIAQQFLSHRSSKTMLKSLIRTPQFLSRSWGRKIPSNWVRISSIQPNSGGTSGNTGVTISGANFGSGTSVKIGGVNCSITSMSASEIQCTTGARVSGTVSVDVQKGTQLDVLPNGFNYVPSATLTSLRQNIFGTSTQNPGKCMSCHNGSGHPLNFANYQSIQGVITPGNSATSDLVIRVSGTSGGSRMPLGGNALSQQEINSIRDWIDSGAPNN